MTSHNREPIEHEGDGDTPRKPYHAPRLTVHGRIEEITAALGLQNMDGITGSSF
jgi:hypothetical protein